MCEKRGGSLHWNLRVGQSEYVCHAAKKFNRPALFLLRGRSSSKETMWPSPRCDVMNRNPELIDIDSNFNYVFTLVLSA